MKVLITSPHVPLNQETRLRMEGRCQRFLSAYFPRVSTIHVSIQDENGPRGGIDKKCLVQARLAGNRTVVATAWGSQVQEAFLGAIERLETRLKRAITRRRTLRQK